LTWLSVAVETSRIQD